MPSPRVSRLGGPPTRLGCVPGAALVRPARAGQAAAASWPPCLAWPGLRPALRRWLSCPPSVSPAHAHSPYPPPHRPTGPLRGRPCALQGGRGRGQCLRAQQPRTQGWPHTPAGACLACLACALVSAAAHPPYLPSPPPADLCRRAAQQEGAGLAHAAGGARTGRRTGSAGHLQGGRPAGDCTRGGVGRRLQGSTRAAGCPDLSAAARHLTHSHLTHPHTHGLAGGHA